TRFSRDWSSDVCSSDLARNVVEFEPPRSAAPRLRPRRRYGAFRLFWFVFLYCARRNTFKLNSRDEPRYRWVLTIRLHISSRDHRSEERRVGKGCRPRTW